MLIKEKSERNTLEMVSLEGLVTAGPSVTENRLRRGFYSYL